MSVYSFHNVSFVGILAQVPIPRFNSLYESFQALTSVQVSHFVEYFSGKQLDSVLTFTDHASGGSQIIDDIIDGGLKLTTGTAGGAAVSVAFNDKRHYSHNNSIYIVVVKRNTTDCRYKTGFSDAAQPANSGGGFAVTDGDDRQSFFRGFTSTGSASSATNTSVSLDTNWHVMKGELGSSNVKFYVDGVLEVTKSTDLPTAKLQPTFYVQTGDAAGSDNGSIRFMELFNTSISINSSLYERWSALTQVLNQRVVEYFVGSGLDTDRWNTTNTQGTATFAMEDSIDGGFKISDIGTGVDDRSSINFNNKRQYDNQDSVFITVVKAGQTTSCTMFAGLSNGLDTFTTTVASVFYNGTTGGGQKSFGSSDGTTQSTTSFGTSDTDWHLIKGDLSASDFKGYVDGVLEVTKSTNLPNAKLQPILQMRSFDAGNVNVSIRYLEAYNKLTTETDYPSYYQLFNELTTVAKTHFVEWFDGNDVSTRRWTKRNITNTNTFSTADAIDEGYSLLTSATADSRMSLDFNNKRQFSNSASEMICVMKAMQINTNQRQCHGLVNDPTVDFGNTSNGVQVESFTSTGFRVATSDGTTLTATTMSLTFDTNWHSYHSIIGASDVKVYADGVLDVTKSTNLPTAKLQPRLLVTTGGAGGAREGRYRYYEAKNT